MVYIWGIQARFRKIHKLDELVVCIVYSLDIVGFVAVECYTEAI